MSEHNSDREQSPVPDEHGSNPKSASRRSVVRGMGALGVTGLLGAGGVAGISDAALGGSSAPVVQPSRSSPDLERWVDELPRPNVLEPEGTKDGQPYYEVVLREVEQQLHRDLPPTTVFGYEGQYPGPTIEARKGEPIYVRWKNELPDEHLLPVDTTVHEDVGPYDTSGSPAVTHLHGGNVESESDGHPRAWFTRDFEETGSDFSKKDYYYRNDQPPTSLWYHDHTIGITRLNVYAGLSGFYLLRDGSAEDLGLPTDEYEIPLLLQDRTFDDDGSLFYPQGVEGNDGGEENPDPSIVSHFFGDTSVVNGKAWPRLSVEPRKYRFRLLDGSNSRHYDLTLLQYDEESGTTDGDGPPLVQIGTDGGFLREPVELDGRLLLGPSERADVVVDFSEYEGETLLLHNDAPSPFRGAVDGFGEDVQPLSEVMLVDVGDTVCSEGSGSLPSELGEVPEIPAESADRNRYLPLTRRTDEYGRALHLQGARDHPDGLRLLDPITEEPGLGDTEIWSFANRTGMSHPMHVHLVQFQVLGRQPLADFDEETDGVDVESLEPPEPSEQGWNDVVVAHPGEVTHVIAHFGEYEGQFGDHTGRYMWHCHMLEHEDHDMMRPYRVVSDDESSTD